MNASVFNSLQGQDRLVSRYAGMPYEPLIVDLDKKVQFRLISRPVLFWILPFSGTQITDPVLLKGYEDPTLRGPEFTVPQGYTELVDGDSKYPDPLYAMMRFSSFVVDRAEPTYLKVFTFQQIFFDEAACWKANFGADPAGMIGPDWFFKYGDALSNNSGPVTRIVSRHCYLDKSALTNVEMDLTRNGRNLTDDLLSICGRGTSIDLPALTEKLFDLRHVPHSAEAKSLLAQYSKATGNAKPGFWL